MERLADLKKRLAQLEEFDPHRLIDAVAARWSGPRAANPRAGHHRERLLV
jgi:hypothetical protein